MQSHADFIFIRQGKLIEVYVIVIYFTTWCYNKYIYKYTTIIDK